MAIRLAQAEEVMGAVRLIATGAAGQAEEAYVKDLSRLAYGPRLGLGGLLVAEQKGRLVSALVPLFSPGRTMLLFVPVHLPSVFHEEALRQLIDQACQRAAAEGVHLAQTLLDIHVEPVESVLRRCGFDRLAELLYLQATIGREPAEPPLPMGCRWETYSPEAHGIFARTILASYERSLDCPSLNGRREIEDILAGHRATGEFDPKLWFVLVDENGGRGVVLLSRVPASEVVELVYLGVSPEYRGTGIADILMRRASSSVSRCGGSRLSLAVDAENVPALRLYWRHGLQAVGRRVALLRDLRQVDVTLGPALEKASMLKPPARTT